MSLSSSRPPAWAFPALLALGLAGCGIAYQSPSVSSLTSDGSKVRVIPITAESVLVANRSAYTPLPVPAAFTRTAGTTAGNIAQGGPAPDGVVGSISPPMKLQTRLPPKETPGPYRIGVGDVLLLATQSGSSVAELSGLLAAQNSRQGYTVQDDGAIAIPNVGRVQVAGKTVQDAEQSVFQALVSHNVDPSFSLEISQFHSQRVSIGGAVGGATVVPITLQPLQLDQALAAAGGMKAPDRKTASIRIYRDGKIYQIPLETYYSDPSLQNLPLQNGDSVFVDTQYDLATAQAYFQQQISLSQFRQQARIAALSQLTSEVALRRSELEEQRQNFQARLQMDGVKRDYVYITGEVDTQSRYALPFGHSASLADALYGAGKGIPTRTGNVAQIYVLRGSSDPREFGAVTAWHLNAKNAANLVLAAHFELHPDDIIFVAEQPITKWNRVLQQFIPSFITTTTTAVTKN